MRRLLLIAAVTATCVAGGAWAQPYKPVTVVRRLAGVQCMALAAVYGPQGSWAPPEPVYSGLGPDAPRVGGGAGVIIVPMPMRTTNGRTQMVWPNGPIVWIAANTLTRWHSLSDPNAVCHPALLSNGIYGFTTTDR